MNTIRNQRRSVIGIVTSDKMNKTIAVRVERTYKHPKYGKYLRAYKKFYAHDEKGEAKMGDRVEIVSTRPLSRLKRWRLDRIVEKAQAWSTPDEPALDGVQGEGAGT
jgi:small subunit ribosomal protein S17